MPDIPVAETSAARYATVHANFATHQRWLVCLR